MFVTRLSWPFLGELSEAARVGRSWGREVGWAMEGHCYGWLWISVWSFFFLEGDQADREAHGSELCISEICWVPSLWLETWSFRQWIWGLSGLLILKMALVPSAFEFLYDFMKLLTFYLSPSRLSWPWGASRGQSPWMNLARGRSHWSPMCPSLCSHRIL